MRVLKFPQRYKVRTVQECFAVHRTKGQCSRIDASDNVVWHGKRYKPKDLSYHLNVSRAHPPKRIIMACGNPWCIHPSHMYTGEAPAEKVIDFFQTFNTLPPKNSRH